MTAALPEFEAAEAEAVQVFLRRPNEANFLPVFRAFAPRLLRFFEFRGCERAVAEDLTQEVMLATYQRAATVRDPSRFRPWVYAVARHFYLMHLRAEGRGGERLELEALSETLHCSDLDPLSRSVLSESMDRLDSLSRRILALRYLDGLEYHEIAEILEMPLGTVQWKVFDAKKKLARSMGAK